MAALLACHSMHTAARHGDTAMPGWIGAQPPAQIGAARLERFMTMRKCGVMAFPPSCCRHRRDDHWSASGQIADSGSWS
jgi:hypothetical protein